MSRNIHVAASPACTTLHESEARYRRVERAAAFGIWEWNMDTGESYFSDRWWAILGYEPDALQLDRETLRALVHPDDLEHLDAVLTRHRQIGTPFEIDLRMRHQSGEYHWIRVRGQVSHDDGIRRMTGSITSINQQKRAEANLQDAYRLAQLGTWEHDFETGTLWWSPQKYRIHGIEPGTPISQSLFLSLVHPADRPSFDVSYAKLLCEGACDEVFRVLRPDGEVRHLRGISSITHDADGHPIRASGTMLDVTDHVRAEEALRRSLAEKDLLLREIHHRVKNNLAIIGSYLYFQTKKINSAEDAAILLDLRQRIKAMALIHDQLCSDCDVARVDFANYVKQLTDDLLRTSQHAPGIHFAVDVMPVLLPIEIATPLGQLLCELITNVIKYAFADGRPGRARVCASCNGTDMFLRVEDEGVGLPSGLDPHAHTSFGWLLVRSLVAQLDGELTVVSDGGVRVSVRFPFVPRPAAPSSGPPPAAATC